MVYGVFGSFLFIKVDLGNWAVVEEFVLIKDLRNLFLKYKISR